MRQYKHDYDAFISHAVEDKIPIANELCARLERAGLRIWYSGKELGIGDSIEKTIENGLHRSRYGIVILSPTYLAKNWTIREFYTLLAKEIEEHKVILPVLYNITLDELKNKDLLMADRFAVNADRGIDHVVDCLVREIKKTKMKKAKVAWFSRIWLVLTASLLINVALLVKTLLPENTSALTAVALNEDLSQRPIMSANFFHDMQALFTQLNSCTCDRSDLRGSTKLVATRRNQYPGGAGQAISKHENRRTEQLPASGKPSKMTMAVVFQIESGSEMPPPEIKINHEDYSMASPEDAVAQSVSSAQDSPFIMASNREMTDDRVPMSCLRAGMPGE